MNIIFVILMTVALGVLVVLYMTYPLFRQRRLSSARFFRDLPPPKKGKLRLRFGKIQLTLPFVLQVMVLLLLLIAFLIVSEKIFGNPTGGMGVWFIIDTSASMSTVQEGEPRMEAAIQELERGLAQARAAAGGKPVCFRLSAMDIERRDIVLEGKAAEIRQAARDLKPRPLGTDLGIIRRAQSLLTESNNDRCRVSHIVMITDQPVPGWDWENEEIEVIWRDIGKPTVNLGFTSIKAARNPLNGQVSEVTVAASTYGAPPPDARIVIMDPKGKEVKNEIIQWTGDGTWLGHIIPTSPGRYRMSISPGGTYRYDDTAVIEVADRREIRVDWQLRNRDILRQLDWKNTKTNPQLRVTANIETPITVPTLIVGPGYGPGGSDPEDVLEIRDFLESSPLLEDVNLDAVEMLKLRGLRLPEGFRPVLRGMDGKTWLAQAENPLCALVPGLPTGTDDVKGRFSATVFFNALRWLLKERRLSPLYTLTAAHNTEPSGNRLALHKDEGNTQRIPCSSGSLNHLKPITGKGKKSPLWPILLAVAVVIFSVERVFSVFKN
jgi:hypothetical protein